MRLNREAVVREMAEGGDVERGAEAGDPVQTTFTFYYLAGRLDLAE